jgi:flagellar hook-basal body complex protein FliE
MTIVPIGSLELVQGLLPQPAGAPARAAGAAGGTGEEASKAVGAAGAAGGASEGGFSGALSQALDALERSQATGETAAAEVALGTSSDPEGAVVKVQNAELEMQLASQLRAKSTEALQTIFQTQV